MVEIRLRSWTPSTRPRCFSCGYPTKTATDTEYGILPFCFGCGATKRRNRSSDTHLLYGKDFFIEIFTNAIRKKTRQKIPREIDEIRRKQIPTETIDSIIKTQQITLIREAMKKYDITISEIEDS